MKRVILLLAFLLSITTHSYAQKGRLDARQSLIYANHDNTLISSRLGMDGGFGQSLGASYFIWDNVNIGLDFSWFNILASSSQISDGTMISGMLSIGYHYSSNSSFEPYVQASIGLASLTRPQPGLINLAGMDDRLLGLKVGVHKKLSEKWDLDFFVSFIDGKTTNFLSTGDPDNIFIYIDSPSSNGPQLKYTHSPRYYYFTFGLGLSYTICGGNE